MGVDEGQTSDEAGDGARSQTRPSGRGAPGAPVKATVAILTFNGEEFLDEVLDACQRQVAEVPFEVLVVDSGSVDATLEIVGRHAGIRLHRIPNSEFGHGRTRNLAARLAAGEIVVFLTQDATPIGEAWLTHLLAPFAADPLLAGVFARQVPRPGCGPAAAREVRDVFRQPPPGFFSNVCSAVRRSALDQVPFRDVDYAEDRGFAIDVEGAGLRVAFIPEASVWHSHDLPLGDYFRRMYDEARGLTEAGRRPRADALWLTAAVGWGTLRDWRFIALSDEYGSAAKLKWAAKAPAYNLSRRVAIWLATRQRLPVDLAARLSLDGRRRRAARA